MALYRAMRLTTNIHKATCLSERREMQQQRSRRHDGMIEGMTNVINQDTVMARTSMGDARSAFNHRVARVRTTYKEQCPRLDVLNSSALSLKSHHAGSVQTWVHLPASHPNWQEATVKDPAWTDCVMTQQLLQARASKNRGDTDKYVSNVVEGRMKD